MAATPISGAGAEYLKLVRDTFPPGKFMDFCAIFYSRMIKRISLRGLALRMQVLLQGHKELRLGLNHTYLLQGYELNIEDEEKLPRTVAEAEALLQKIKDRLEESRYGRFSRALEQFATFPKPPIIRIFRLFSLSLMAHDDLFEEFTKFLPPDMLAIRDDVPSFPERVRTTGGGGDGSDSTCGISEYVELLRDTLPHGKFKDFCAVLESYRDHRLSSRGLLLRVQVLLQGHKELRLGLNANLPQGYEVDVEDKEKLPRTLAEAQALLQKIKDRFPESRYTSFSRNLEQLGTFPKPPIIGIFRLFSWNLTEHDDLFEEFTKFLPPDTLAIRDDVPSFPERVRTTRGGGAGPREIMSAMNKRDNFQSHVVDASDSSDGSSG
ncbi:paired amphipathic helix protein Sin3-like 2 [Ananas comosus]|uniref:Paired amphipathic helix protein Sin3-like 2 n=1 Tax=Ananas comosus TaxID=4615 RepID=A0A6P5FMD1_ANACO|nr:paired amphipathic helix protein Sin3-like 2 [Ananas comosus]XP_020097109.1 paired amphipathic helix protein Sin3-like 2 [Ananas comosus]